MKRYYEVLDDSGKTPVPVQFEPTHAGFEKAIQYAKDKNLPFVSAIRGETTETVWTNEPVIYRA